MPLDAALKLAENDPIWTNRGQAIQSYAILEQSLCHALAQLGDMKEDVALSIFRGGLGNLNRAISGVSA
jgi:hypothetical protein